MAGAKARPELVLNATSVNGIGMEVWGRPDGAERAPLAVVCLPGNPALQFGSSHARSPLIGAVVAALRGARVPVVSFDYRGVGLSAPGGPTVDPKKWQIPEDGETTKNALEVVGLAKVHLSDRVVVCGYSYGSSKAVTAVLHGGGHAYISLSMGCNVFKFMTDPWQQEVLKQDMELQSTLACRALYVVGEKDRMTPLDEVKRLIGARADAGEGATVEVIRNGTHDLKGLESVAADFCAGFVTELHEELAAAGETAREASEPATAPAADYDFRVTCLKYEEGSLLDSFHVTLPEDAKVAALRRSLGPALPENAKVCEFDGLGFKVLKDDEALPPWVTIEEFKGVIGLDNVLTVNQCKEAQAMMRAALQRPEIQKKLDQLERDANKVDAKYRMLLTKLLNTEVYPDIISHFTLPEGYKGKQLLLNSIPAKSDVGMVRSWLELERLMRNKEMIQRAEGILLALGAGQQAVGA